MAYLSTRTGVSFLIPAWGVIRAGVLYWVFTEFSWSSAIKLIQVPRPFRGLFWEYWQRRIFRSTDRPEPFLLSVAVVAVVVVVVVVRVLEAVGISTGGAFTSEIALDWRFGIDQSRLCRSFWSDLKKKKKNSVSSVSVCLSVGHPGCADWKLQKKKKDIHTHPRHTICLKSCAVNPKERSILIDSEKIAINVPKGATWKILSSSFHLQRMFQDDAQII